MMIFFDPHAGTPRSRSRFRSRSHADRSIRPRMEIERLVGCVFGVEEVEIGRTSRGCAATALARQVAMYLTHVVCGMSLTEVGSLFDRDRTTVAHACGLIEDRRDDPAFDRVLELLEHSILGLLLLRRGGASLPF